MRSAVGIDEKSSTVDLARGLKNSIYSYRVVLNSPGITAPGGLACQKSISRHTFAGVRLERRPPCRSLKEKLKRFRKIMNT